MLYKSFLNDFRRNILIMYLLFLVGICTYVPWKAANSSVRMPAGYAYIWDVPAYYSFYPNEVKTIGVKETYNPFWDNTKTNSSAMDTMLEKTKTTKLPISGIDTERLFVEILGLTAVFGIILLIGEHGSVNKEG